MSRRDELPILLMLLAAALALYAGAWSLAGPDAHHGPPDAIPAGAAPPPPL